MALAAGVLDAVKNALGVAHVSIDPDTCLTYGTDALQRGHPADLVVIPAGTGHWFTKIDDHINYLMIRIDPDKVTPLKSEAQSKEYLSKPAPRQGGQ